MQILLILSSLKSRESAVISTLLSCLVLRLLLVVVLHNMRGGASGDLKSHGMGKGCDPTMLLHSGQNWVGHLGDGRLKRVELDLIHGDVTQLLQLRCDEVQEGLVTETGDVQQETDGVRHIAYQKLLIKELLIDFHTLTNQMKPTGQ